MRSRRACDCLGSGFRDCAGRPRRQLSPGLDSSSLTETRVFQLVTSGVASLPAPAFPAAAARRPVLQTGPPAGFPARSPRAGPIRGILCETHRDPPERLHRGFERKAPRALRGLALGKARGLVVRGEPQVGVREQILWGGMVARVYHMDTQFESKFLEIADAL